jgi:hypothetical protein|tara:strand:+ start:58 stop:276 length:219 start_codon:yes stop_codon:yes gene_type:complete
MITPISHYQKITIYDHGITDNQFDATIILLLLHIPLIIGAKISKKNKTIKKLLFVIYIFGMALFISAIIINI